MQDECGLRNWFLKAVSENTEADTWWISKALGALSITEHHGWRLHPYYKQDGGLEMGGSTPAPCSAPKMRDFCELRESFS